MRMQLMKDNLSETDRSNLIELLNNRLADCVDLQTKTAQASCNVKDPHSSELYNLFDDMNEEVEQNVANIADRVAQLGAMAEAKTQSVAFRPSLPEYPLTLSSGRDQVTALAEALASFGWNVRQAIGLSREFGDGVTADIFTRVSHRIDKWLWMVQAHLQEG
jgi:starvation-inducible DNA-binding protein